MKDHIGPLLSHPSAIVIDWMMRETRDYAAYGLWLAVFLTVVGGSSGQQLIERLVSWVWVRRHPLFHPPPSTAHHPLSTVHRPPSTVHRHRPPSIVRPPSTVPRPPSTVHRPPRPPPRPPLQNAQGVALLPISLRRATPRTTAARSRPCGQPPGNLAPGFACATLTPRPPARPPFGSLARSRASSNGS